MPKPEDAWIQQVADTLRVLALRLRENLRVSDVSAIVGRLEALGPPEAIPKYSHPVGHRDSSTLAGKAKEAIDRDFAKKISAKSMAERFSVSPKRLNREFRHAYGMLPRAYLRHVRLEHAMRHLMSDDKLETIAKESGFHRASLWRAYRETRGRAPSVTRKGR